MYYSSRMILDTGTMKHMTGYKHLFINLIRLYNKFVTLGDGLTQLPAHSVGSIVVIIDNNLIQIDYALYVPGMKDNLFSVTERIKLQGCSMIVKNNNHILSFPKFTIKVIIDNEVFVYISSPSNISSTTVLVPVSENNNNNNVILKNTILHKTTISVSFSFIFILLVILLCNFLIHQLHNSIILNRVNLKCNNSIKSLSHIPISQQNINSYSNH